jgi:serine protease Do
MKRVSLLLAAFLLSCASAALAAPQEAATTPAPAPVIAQGHGSYLGVALDEVTPETVSRLRLRAERGAVITGVTSDSPAAKAGLQKDDVIIRWDGEQIESAIQLSRIRRETPPGRTVRLGIVRDGREMEVSVQLGERARRIARAGGRIIAPRVTGPRFRPQRISRAGTFRLRHVGMQMMSLTPQMAEYFGLGQRSGALVTWVDQDSSAAKAGLKAGDVILSVGGQAVASPAEAWRALRQKAGESVEIRVMRDRQEQSFTVQLDKNAATSWLIEPDMLNDVVIPATPIVVPLPSIELPSINLPELPALAPMPQIELSPLPLMRWKYRIEI